MLWVRHERADIRQLEQEAAEADKLLEESEKEKEIPEEVNVGSVDTKEDNKGKVSDADVEKFLKALAAEGKVSDADVEKLLKEVAAEKEEEEKEDLSAEEMAKRENRRKAKELWEKIGKIIQGAGGGIHSSTHPEEMQELVRLIEGAAGGPTILTEMNNTAMMLQKYINANGEVRTSDLLKIADYYESELGELGELIDPRTATVYRNMARYATIKGCEVINLYEIINADDFEEVLKAHDESTK